MKVGLISLVCTWGLRSSQTDLFIPRWLLSALCCRSSGEIKKPVLDWNGTKHWPVFGKLGGQTLKNLSIFKGWSGGLWPAKPIRNSQRRGDHRQNLTRPVLRGCSQPGSSGVSNKLEAPSSFYFGELEAHALEYVVTKMMNACHMGKFLIILGFVGLSDCLFAFPSIAIYLAKKNIKRKGILEEYEKVRNVVLVPLQAHLL